MSLQDEAWLRRLRAREAAQARRHGLAPAALARMREQQGGLCAICGVGPAEVVDHDHGHCPGPVSCGRCVRGIICDDCNQGLGRFHDDPERMREAAEYIERWQRGGPPG